MSDSKTPRNLKSVSPDAPAEAREQADEYKSLWANRPITLDDGTDLFIPPHPDFKLLDDEAMDAYDELMFEMDTEYEREPDIHVPEQRLRDKTTGKESGVVLPPSTVRGALKEPFRKVVDGKSVLVKPSHSVKVAQIALGETKYKQLREGGKSAGDVWRLWSEWAEEINDRRGRQATAPSPVALAAVSETDSQ